MDLDIELGRHELSDERKEILQQGDEAIEHARVREGAIRHLNIELGGFSLTMSSVARYERLIEKQGYEIERLEAEDDGSRAQEIADAYIDYENLDSALEKARARLERVAVEIDRLLAIEQAEEGKDEEAFASLERAMATTRYMITREETRNGIILERITSELTEASGEIPDFLSAFNEAFEDLKNADASIEADSLVELGATSVHLRAVDYDSFLATHYGEHDVRSTEASAHLDRLVHEKLPQSMRDEIDDHMQKALQKDELMIDEVPDEFEIDMSNEDVSEGERVRRSAALMNGASARVRQAKKDKPRFYASKEKKAAWKERFDEAWEFYREQYTYHSLAKIERAYVKKLFDDAREEVRVCAEISKASTKARDRMAPLLGSIRRADKLTGKMNQLSNLGDSENVRHRQKILDSVGRMRVQPNNKHLQRFLERHKGKK